MKRNRKTATAIFTLAMLATAVTSCVVFTYLPISRARISLTIGSALLGIVVSLLLYLVVTLFPDRRSSRISAVLLFTLLVTSPLVSAAMNRITFSRFGFTVYGVTPIPILDITVNNSGILWFRPKTHQITRAELDAIIGPGVDVVVVGIGWDSVAQLTDEAKQLSDLIDLRVLPTPKAFGLYNALKAEGRNVVLLAHSTC
jgi:hypothetical protein